MAHGFCPDSRLIANTAHQLFYRDPCPRIFSPWNSCNRTFYKARVPSTRKTHAETGRDKQSTEQALQVGIPLCFLLP